MALRLSVKEQWKRHFFMDDTKEEYLNSRGTRLEMADYDVNFMNYVFKRTLVESKAPVDEINSTKYYYAVLRGVDFDKMLKTGRIPIGREY